MSFLLTIRHNLEAIEDHFGQSTVTRFDLPRVRVGSGAECEQQVPDSTVPAVLFTIVAAGAKLDFVPGEATGVFVNGKPAQAERELLSGDEIRLGHWTFHVHKTYGEAGDPRRRTGLAALARLLVVLVLLAELGVVVWLPRQVQAAAQRGNALARLRTFSLLDSLRNRAAAGAEQETETETDTIRIAAQRAIGRDLEQRAQYLRRHGDNLSSAQCRRMYDELKTLADILDHLGTAELLQPIPEVNIDAAIHATLQSAPAETKTP